MSANFVARQLGYHMTEGWSQGDRATQDYFRPVETFEARFDALLREIRELGFDAMDLWLAHLHPSWATPEHIAITQQLLAQRGLTVVSLAGGFGDSLDAFEASCRLAVAVGAPVLGGGTELLRRDHAGMAALLDEYDLVLGVENHPEKDPAELSVRMGDAAGGRVGAAVDTGWFGTQGYPAERALEELADRLTHVHLKQVEAAGAHHTCGFDHGVVDIEGCVRALQRLGYGGAISVEHEPEDRNPGPECVASRALLEGWLENTEDTQHRKI
jgi:sugar phosphate isomerase/epimerase